MRNGSLCSCGNDPYGPETSDDCNVPCVDGKMCGGENVYSVYTTDLGKTSYLQMALKPYIPVQTLF